jgi:hypothetical protein
MKIITLDIDDCIFPSDNTYFGRTNDSLKILEINMRRIEMMIKKYNMLVYITSSWYSILKLEGNNIIYNNPGYGLPGKTYYDIEKKAFDIISRYINGYIVGLSKGDRYSDVNRLLDEGCIIVNLDDMDFSEVKHKNHLWVEMEGFLDNGKIYKIDSFLKDRA